MSSCADVGTLRLYLVAAAFCTPRTYREGHAEQFAPTPLTLVVPRPATLRYHVHLGVAHFVIISNECDDREHAA